MTRAVATLYAILLYGFIFLPVAVLVLFSFQGTLFPIPPFNGPSLRWYVAVLGDARLELARLPKGRMELLAVDAFSSDAIPLHLMTDEAMGVYLGALSPQGILLIQ